MKRPTDRAEEEFLITLAEGAAALGIELSADGIEKIRAHRVVLLKWSKRMNLTTVCDPEGMAELLYLDSMVLLPHLEFGTDLHDIGTGAGFPGLVVKALRPDVRVVLSEARQKKVSFLRQAAREMLLGEGLEIYGRRLGHDAVNRKEGWSEVVSRAAFPPNEWVRLGSPLVSRGGRLWIFSGQPVGESLEEFDGELPAGFEPVKKFRYRLPRTAKDRLLVCLRRTP